MKQLRKYQQEAVNQTWQALKANNDPVLFTMSVGGGKSLCISSILGTIEKANKKALCLVNSAELVRNNSKTHLEQGGKCSVFCASLKSKDTSNNIIFATPQSIFSAIKRGHPIADIIFNLIVIDEAHTVAYKNHKSIFMRILRHYKQEYKDMRLLGLTGTPYRWLNESIVGSNCLFKTEVAKVNMAWLIENGYLAKPRFTVPETEGFDFSSLKVRTTGNFDNNELQSVIDKNIRLTGEILLETQKIMANRNGAFIFLSTKSHCFEAYKTLPPELTRIILGDTPNEERNESLELARQGKIKYLLSINCLMTGIDVPFFDTSIWLRPTSSLILFTQGIGRALRLHESKVDGLVLDFAGNLERHQDWDNPLLLAALKETRDKDAELVFQCYKCNTMNSEHARRCVGIVNDKRCEHFFEFKECTNCQVQNDITSRHCRSCQHELIDPNAKLSLDALIDTSITLDVTQAKYWITERNNGFIFNAAYECINGFWFYESFTPTASEIAKNMFYGSFVKKHVKRSSDYYPYLQNMIYMRAMLNDIEIPAHLKIVGKDIKGKVFAELDNLYKFKN